jgi:hypothetical protein
MTRMMLARAALAVLLGTGVGAGLARAGGTDYYPSTPPQANVLPPGYPPVDSSPSKHPVYDWVRYGRPLGYWSSFNGYGCSSLKSEVGFIFGSCRMFYGEPYLKGPPPSPLPPWSGPESGYQNYPPPAKAGGGYGNYPPTGGAYPVRQNCPSCGNW